MHASQRTSPLTLGPVLAATLALLATAPHALGGEHDWLQGPDGNWYALTTSKHDWQGAQAEAASVGGDLCSIHSVAENVWLVEQILSQMTPEQVAPHATPHAWIGFNDLQQEGSFTWADGADVTFTYWSPGEPNDAGSGEDCAILNWSATGAWNDATCSDPFLGIIELQSLDCDQNGVPDSYEGLPAGQDCNGNGVCDASEIASGSVPDVNGNGLPDDCESAGMLPYRFESLVVFGDSLSDTGNLYAMTGLPPSPPNADGRFSDGAVWVEYLAGYLGISPVDTLNLAVGGATSGHGNTIVGPGAGLLDQVESYVAAVDVADRRLRQTLFVLWIGANDFDTTYDPELLVGGAMDNIAAAIRSLARAGAPTVLVPNLPDLALTPRVALFEPPEVAPLAHLATVGFNANLSATLSELEQECGVDILLVDVFTLFNAVVADPDAFGFSDAVTPWPRPREHPLRFAGNPRLLGRPAPHDRRAQGDRAGRSGDAPARRRAPRWPAMRHARLPRGHRHARLARARHVHVGADRDLGREHRHEQRFWPRRAARGPWAGRSPPPRAGGPGLEGNPPCERHGHPRRGRWELPAPGRRPAGPGRSSPSSPRCCWTATCWTGPASSCSAVTASRRKRSCMTRSSPTCPRRRSATSPMS